MLPHNNGINIENNIEAFHVPIEQHNVTAMAQ